MDLGGVDRLRGELEAFTADVFASATRKGWQQRAGEYLRGLMIDGRRKSIQPMAARLGGVDEQALNHFVTNSPWDVVPVRSRLAQRMAAVIGHEAVVLDDTGFCKDGSWSACVSRQYTGTAGKVTNCQIAVSAHLVTDAASYPANWRLFVPETWDPDSPKARADVSAARVACQVPDEAVHREKWRLGLDMLDELIDWGVTIPRVAADAGYGDATGFRQGLAERGLSYVVAVKATTSAYSAGAEPVTPHYAGRGRPPVARYRDADLSCLRRLAMAAPARSWRRVSWRHGTKTTPGNPTALMRGRFLAMRVRPANRDIPRGPDGSLPEAWLIAERPPGQDEPSDYWLSNLPPDTPINTLTRLAKIRWRIEHDYRELKHGLGLDHYEGRTWPGWHHHVTLAAAAHAFLTLHRLSTPKAEAPA